MWVAFGVGAVAVSAIAGLAGMIAVGTSEPPPYLASIGEPFRKIDFRDLPPLQTTPRPRWDADRFPRVAASYTRRPRAHCHRYPRLIRVEHKPAALNAEGLTVYAPDMRGHGGIGRRGDLD